MAKLNYLTEFIEQERCAAGKTSHPFAISGSLGSRAVQITVVSRTFDEANIWQRALQVEVPALFNSAEACKLQNDGLQTGGNYLLSLNFKAEF